MQPRNPNNAQGIDVSHWQGAVDWAKVKAAGKSFAVLKATEGTLYIDDTLGANFAGCKANGIAVGLYHFSRANTIEEAIAEANLFISVVDGFGGIEALDIPPILDIESAGDKTRVQVTAICHKWLEIVEQKYRVKPMIYSYPAFIDAFLDGSLSSYPLWLASYGVEMPPDRCGWSEWTFIQYTDGGAVNGVSGAVDCNEFKGTEAELLYRLSADDANKIINTFLSPLHGAMSAQSEKDELHRLANELRKASGQPTT